MASGSNDWAKNAIIDEIVIYQKFGKPLPQPKNGEYDQDQLNQIDTFICKNMAKGARGYNECEIYGRLVNKHVDGDLACKWGKQLESTIKTTQDVTKQITGVATQIQNQGGLIGLLGNIVGAASSGIGSAAGATGCNAYVLGNAETIDSIYAIQANQPAVALPMIQQPSSPPARVPQSVRNLKKSKIIGNGYPKAMISYRRSSNTISARRT